MIKVDMGPLKNVYFCDREKYIKEMLSTYSIVEIDLLDLSNFLIDVLGYYFIPDKYYFLECGGSCSKNCINKVTILYSDIINDGILDFEKILNIVKYLSKSSYFEFS